MKKIKIIIFALIILLIGVGIFLVIKKFSFVKNTGKQLETEFSSGAVINIDKKNYECDFSHLSGTTKINIKKPETVKGFIIEWSNGKQTVTFKDLKKEFDKPVIPKDSFLNLIVKILDNFTTLPINKIKNDGRREVFTGKIENNEFEITSENSKIIEIFIKSKDAKINFEYQE